MRLTSVRLSTRRAAAILFFVLAGCLITSCKSSPQRQGVFIRNPYDQVDWARDGRFLANFHTHTTGSDGGLLPHDAIDHYRNLGYSILAITDHNAVTYPWEKLDTLEPSAGARDRFAAGKLESAALDYENRDPAELGMIAIQGCELSVHHHIGSFFNDHSGTTVEADSLKAVSVKEGIAMLNHPGRYKKTVDWYVDLYETFPVLFGLEVYNQGDRYPGDRKTWDAILARTMPDRPVWGYSNDDMHSVTRLGRNWNVMLIPELSQDWTRRGMTEGRSYFVYSPAGHEGTPHPVIDAITVDHEADVITIEATGHTNISWISEGHVIHHGKTLNLSETPGWGSYVRAELYGVSNSVAGTQPFGLIPAIRTELVLVTEPSSVEYPEPGHVRGLLNLRNTTGKSITVQVTVVLESRELLQRKVAIDPGDVGSLPLSVPVEALNKNRQLDVLMDLGADFGALRKISSRHPLAVASPVELSINLPSIGFAHVTARNMLASMPVAVRLSTALDGGKTAEEAFTLAPSETYTFPVNLPADLLGKAAALTAEVEFAAAVSPVPVMLSALLDLSRDSPVPRLAENEAWGDPARQLNTEEQVFPVSGRSRWEGVEDLNAKVFWGWDGEFLCIMAEVRDDAHFNKQEASRLWDGDSLQVAVVAEGGKSFNLCLAQTSEGIILQQWQGSDTPLHDSAVYGVERNDETQTTRYELRLPLSLLGIEPASGSRFGLGTVIFDDDAGHGHDFWMQSAPGIAGGWSPDSIPRFYLAQ